MVTSQHSIGGPEFGVVLDTGVLSSGDPVCRFGTGWRTGIGKIKDTGCTQRLY